MAGLGHDLRALGEQLAAARGRFGCAFVAPLRVHVERGEQPGSRSERREVRVEAVGALLRLERPRFEVVLALGEIARLREPQRVRVTHRQRAGQVGTAEPLLCRDGVEVGVRRVDGDRAGRLRAVDEHGDAGRLAQLAPRKHDGR